MSKTSVQIIDLMKKNPVIKLQEVANQLNLSKRAVEMQVKKLREQGKVKRIGATKNGSWQVEE
jgi:ATP-dependent DNA helicase RecG